MGVRKGATKFIDRVNAWIDTNTKNGKLNAIYKKFHGVDLPPELQGS
jgi:polar amino acid transport system substrate-binding protein